MKIYNLKAAPIASVEELKNEKRPKAKQILLGTDTHLRGYQVGRKIDHAAVGVVENFRSEEALLLFVEKQLERAERVVVVYEAGPLGYSLYRKLKLSGWNATSVRRIAVSSKRSGARTTESMPAIRPVSCSITLMGIKTRYRWSGCQVKPRNSCG